MWKRGCLWLLVTTSVLVGQGYCFWRAGGRWALAGVALLWAGSLLARVRPKLPVPAERGARR